MGVAEASIKKTVTKREVFVSLGCARYPYAKIKELFGKEEKLDLKGLSNFAIADDEKVQLIQQMDLLEPGLLRIIAFKFTVDALEVLSKELHAEEKNRIEEFFAFLKDAFSGGHDYELVEQRKREIHEYIDHSLRPLGVSSCFRRIATFELLLALSNRSPKRALIEVSSIQRDVLGEDEQGTKQLQTIVTLFDLYHQGAIDAD